MQLIQEQSGKFSRHDVAGVARSPGRNGKARPTMAINFAFDESEHLAMEDSAMDKKITKWLEPISPHAHWLVRVALLSIFLYHGVNKFMGEGIGGFAEMTELPYLIAMLVALTEIVGSILIVVGGFMPGWVTRLGSLVLIPVMLGAIFMVHWGQWHFMPSETHPMGGMQFQVMILLLLFYLLIQGNQINHGGRASAVASP